MAKIIAKFSNGFEDEYKGHRAVKAAWMITDAESGEVLDSGHSRDRAAAAKTAEGSVAEVISVSWDEYPSFYLPRSAQHLIGESAKYLIKRVREAGLADDIPVGKLKLSEAFRRAKDANARRRAAQRLKAKIEIIDL